jgi:hypothetical protein
LRCPIGVWPKDKTLKLSGLYWRIAISDGLMGVAKRPMERGLGWSTAEIEVFLVGVRKSLMDSSFHSYICMFVCAWGRLDPQVREADKFHRPLHMLYGQKPFETRKETDQPAVDP